MKTPSSSSEKLVRITAACSLFGFADSTHFRRHVAARLGLNPIAVGNHWYLLQGDVDRAFASMLRTAASKSPTAPKE